ncbi:hypothetical protein GUITHDRAFT_83216, partial [Guillardia theta CCMP2712]
MRISHTKFFLGNDQKQRFGQVLRRVLSTEDMQEEEVLRLRLKCAGSHSFRKGSVTHLLGIPGGPVSTSIFQR